MPITPEKDPEGARREGRRQNAALRPVARFPTSPGRSRCRSRRRGKAATGRRRTRSSERQKLRAESARAVEHVMMRLPHFTFHAPRTRARSGRAARGAPAGAMLVAGGTDLLPNMKRRQQCRSTLIGLRRVAELRADLERRRLDDWRRRDADRARARRPLRRPRTRQAAACGRRPPRSRRRTCATWARSAATSASTRAATTTTRTTSGGRRSTSA